MSDTNMPAVEVKSVSSEQELSSYELAYHILPTVAEGEVIAVIDELKTIISNAGGQIFDEENAERFELAYEIDKYLEGKYRKFTSAYFGWVRFRLVPSSLSAITESVESHKTVLRSLVIRLTKAEEANSFRFHEALVDTKIRIIDTDVVDTEVADVEDIVDEVAVSDVVPVVEAEAKIA